jgi:stage IV sporulation protein FB
MLGMSETSYDLKFQLLGIPVRVHPLFWLVAILLAGPTRGLDVVFIWVICVFVSVLVHEFGHGLVAKSFGAKPSIALLGGFGLCIYNEERESPFQRLAVVLSGPGAGFVFGAVVMLLYSIVFGITFDEHMNTVRYLVGLSTDPFAIGSMVQKLVRNLGMERAESTNYRIYLDLVYINLMWGLVNLLPIFPLDGGRVSEIGLMYIDPYNGKRWGHTLSLVVAGLLAVVTFARASNGEYFLPFFFAGFAFINYQLLQSIHQAQLMGIYDDDWWKR